MHLDLRFAGAVLAAALVPSPARAGPVEPSRPHGFVAADAKFPREFILGEWWTEEKDGRIRIGVPLFGQSQAWTRVR